MSESIDTLAQDERAPPLAHLAGRRPAAPPWFDRALQMQPERTLAPVGDAQIELLTWGERGKPGLIFVPGLSAHADWWSFLAPLLADDYRVAAISLSGMGASSWRERYAFDVYAEEIVGAAEAAGLYESPLAPIYVGHSHGGMAVFFTACRNAHRMRGAIMVDTGFGVGVPGLKVGEIWKRPEDAEAAPPPKTYPSVEEALVRFRLMPAQPCSNLYIVDHIARTSLKPMRLEEGQDAWAWRFDPALLRKIYLRSFNALQGARPPAMVHIMGDRSSMMARTGGNQAPFLRSFVRPIRLQDCDHHVMIDRPLELAHTVRQIAARWWA